MTPRLRTTAIAASGLLAALGSLAAVPTAGASPSPSAAAAPAVSARANPRPALRSGWKPRPEKYHKTVTTTDLKIKMDDGTILRGDLIRPARVDGRPVAKRLPVVITITAYNKAVLGAGAGAVLAGADPAYLVKRGYAQLTVDARGTGSSEGTWAAFSSRENKDAGRIVAWAHRQPWSNGRSAMTGASYMGISQLFAAEHQPPGLKAIFPQVPAADVYRDVVASGGQIDVGFIPLWLGAVTLTGLVPPAYGLSEPAHGMGWALDHLTAATSFTGPLMLKALLGGEPAYDGPFYKQRSPIVRIKKIKVPTFFISGEYDLFQRGTPLDFEALQRKGVPTRIITGPWDHIGASSGTEIAKAGYGTLAELQLRWFDHYVRGVRDKHLLSDIAPYTYYEQGSGRWRRTRAYVAKDLHAVSFKLSGTAKMGGRSGVLTRGAAKPATSTLVPLPVTGLCTRSANQWTAGVVNAAIKNFPCFTDNRLNDAGGLTFATPKLKKRLRIQGPINARLYTSTLTGDGMLSVAVEDVAPNGKVSRLTGGWQVISHRALDRKRSRYLNGRLIQPFHPFTRKAQRDLPRGKVAPIDVEIFPTGAVIRPGHRLRISVQGFDVPHLLSPLPNLLPQLSPLRIHVSKRYRSVLTVPVR